MYISGPGSEPDSTARDSTQVDAFKQLLSIERIAREAENLNAFQYVVVNETYSLVNYQQAVLVKLDRNNLRAEVRAASGIAAIDRNAPAIRWLESVITKLAQNKQLDKLQTINPDDINEAYRADYETFAAAHVLWCPLKLPSGNMLGGLWLTRDNAWTESEYAILQQLADSFAFIWTSFEKPGRYEKKKLLRRGTGIIVTIVLFAAMFIPVPLSVLAPAEVVAREFSIIAAPMAGVIKEIEVKPNAPVKKGDLLFKYDDVDLRGQYAVAVEEYAVAESEYRNTAQKAVHDPDSRDQLAILKAMLAQNQAEQTYIGELLARLDVRAPRDGIVVINNVDDWRGQPVVAGERVMKVAKPDEVEIRIFLPVGDAIILKEGAPIRLFLDTAPLYPLSAKLLRANYEAEKTPDDNFAFRITASFDDVDQSQPRIGLRGTARISGQQVSLFFYLFRRPISALRQFIGI
jgi:multidrug efflux pump subunit AcrA (membrane-fusion protein)